MPTEPHFSQKSQKVLDLEARIKELESYIAEDGVSILIAERDTLKGWKESALQTLNAINLQEVGKELNLGTDIAPQILPRIQTLKTERNFNATQIDRLTDALEKCAHDEWNRGVYGPARQILKQ